MMADIKEATTIEVEDLMNKDNVVVIDVREDEEVAQGIIEKAKHIPLGNIPEAASELDKSKDYILVCRSGGRSMKAAKYLEEQGFKVTNMQGGMLNWKGEVTI